MASIINGRLTVASNRTPTPQDPSFSGWTVSLAYTAPVEVAAVGGLPAVQGRLDQQRVATVESDGRFSWTWAEKDGSPVESAQLVVRDSTGAVMNQLSLDKAALAQEIKVTVPAPKVLVLQAASPDLEKGASVEVTGRLLSQSGRALPAGVSIALWGVPFEDGSAPEAMDELTLSSMTFLQSFYTQDNGYFSFVRPAQRLGRVVAQIQGRTTTEVALDSDHKVAQRLVLMVSDEVASTLSEQTSIVNTGTPRLPTAMDLVENASAFSQDLGSSCVELAVPNRVLEEFCYRYVVRVSEPQVRPLTQGKPTVKNIKVLERYVALVKAMWVQAGGDAREFDLKPQDLVGLSAHELDALLKTLTKAPQRSAAERLQLIKRIEDLIRLVQGHQQGAGRVVLDSFNAIDWDDTPTLNESCTLALGHVLHYRQQWRADGYSLGDLLYSLPLAPGQKRKIAILDWDRRTQSTRSEDLEEEEYLRGFLERDRDVLDVVNSHLDQRTDASSSSSTWGGGGGIGGGFIGNGWGIFGGVAGGGGGAATQADQTASRNLSAQSLQQLRDQTTQRASSVRDQRSTVIQTLAQSENVNAQTEVVANYNHCHAITVEYFEVLRHFQLTHELVNVSECLFVPLRMSWFDHAKVLRWRDALQGNLLNRSLRPAFDAVQRIQDNWVGWDFPPERYSQLSADRLEGELRISFVLPRPRDDADGAMSPPNWGWLSTLIGTTIYEMYNTVILPAQQAQRDQVFRERVAPVIAQKLVNQLRFSLIAADGTRHDVPLDATLVSRFVEGVDLYVSLQPAGGVPSLPREDIVAFGIQYTGPELPVDAQVLVRSGKVRWMTDIFTGVLFQESRILNDLGVGDEVIVSTAVSHNEMRNPREEDRTLAAKLIRHLNDNLEHYHQAIWSRMDPARRFMLLDGVIVPGTGGLSVASLVENQVIGIVGNALVMPAVPGIRLDTRLAPDNVRRQADLMDAYATTPAPALRVSLPTRGVFAEAVMGHCNSCEVKDDSLFWRWDESPIPDEPPTLMPLSTDSRKVDDGELKPTATPPAIVNYQQFPVFPDPMGLSTALQILQKADLFKDITGLDQTQRNALSSFEKALGVAKAFGGKAAAMALQQETGRNVDRTLQQIEAARSSGALTQAQASELAYGTLRTLTGSPSQADSSPLASPAVEQAVQSAATSDRADVTIATPQETVEASFDGADTASDASVVGGVPRITVSDQQSMVSMDLVLENLNSTAKPSTFARRPGFKSLASLSALVSAPGVTTLRSVGMIDTDPADATRFRTRVKYQLVFPARRTDGTRPVGNGRLPLAVLLHGNHRAFKRVGGVLVEVDSYKGYRYLQEELAAQGIASISVDTNMANSLGSFIEMRADLALAAMAHLRQQTEDPTSRLYHRIDFDKVGLMGHSRGGDAVVRMVQKNLAAPAASRCGIQTVCSLAPTDVTGGQVPASRMFLDRTDLPFYSVVYGAWDGDVSGMGGADDAFGTGFRHYDRARCPKALVYVERCCHNSFNSVWHADGLDAGIAAADLPNLASEALHQTIAKEYICGQMRWHLKGVQSVKALFYGTTASRTGLQVMNLWSFGTTFQHIDDFENPAGNLANGTRPAAPAGVAIQDFGSITIGAQRLNDHVLQQSHVMHADTSGAAPKPLIIETSLGAGFRNWSGFNHLGLDVGAFFDVTSAATIAAGTVPAFTVVLVDGAGATASATAAQCLPAVMKPLFHQVEFADSMGVVHAFNATALHTQSLRVPLSLMRGINLSDVRTVRVSVDVPAGHLFVDHIKAVAI